MNPAPYLARHLWFGMLWLMRRPRIRRLQRLSIAWIPAQFREKARRSYLRQERWARRHGLKLLTMAISLFFVSLMLTLTLMGLLEAISRGWIPLPSAPEAAL